MTLLCVSSMIFAQLQTQVATLKHGSNINVFYGQDAFKDAYTAAASGDIITLSSGTFNATNIEKPITLRGAGCMDDEEQNTLATVIPGTVYVNISDASNYLTIEGIIFEGDFQFNYLINEYMVYCSAGIHKGRKNKIVPLPPCLVIFPLANSKASQRYPHATFAKAPDNRRSRNDGQKYPAYP